MGLPVTMHFDEADKAAFRNALERWHSDLATTPSECIQRGTIELCKSMRVSTKLSMKKRPLVDPETTGPFKSRKEKKDASYWYFKNGGRSKFWWAIGYKTNYSGEERRFPIFADTKAQAKRSPKLNVKRRGLVAASWGWAMQKLFNVAGEKWNANLSEPNGAMSVSKMMDRESGYAEVIIENKLSYIDKALMGGKGPAVSTAMARAAKSMMHQADAKIAKITRESGY